MKRAMLVLAALVVFGFVAGAVTAEEEMAWFDLTNCSMCKQMANEEGLFENTTWETHLIANGAMSIITVEESHKAAFERAHKNMQEVGMKLHSGEKMHLCGFCQSYGMLMMSGAKVESVEGKISTVNLMTSTDPEVVEKIQAHAQKTIDEYKEMKDAEEAQGS